MTLPAVQEAMMKGKPLIGGFDQRHIVEPMGGTRRVTPESDPPDPGIANHVGHWLFPKWRRGVDFPPCINS